MSISQLLKAQKVDKERLIVLANLAKGPAKTELDKAQRTIDDAKAYLLQLENDAKTLQENFKKIAKILNDTMAAVQKAKQAPHQNLAEYDEYHAKLSTMEGQLADIERRITEKMAAFKNTTLTVMRATESVSKNKKAYETQKQTVMTKVQELEQEFTAQVKGVDEKLLTKYQAVRRAKNGDTKDVVVPLVDKRCQGCYMDVPAAIISKIDTNGWATCEECGRIIYKDDQPR